MKALEILNNYKKFDGFVRDIISDSFLNEAIKGLESLNTAQQPTQNKFKVGDWAVHPEARHPWRITQNSLDHLVNTELKLWKPQLGEWCWFYEDTEYTTMNIVAKYSHTDKNGHYILGDKIGYPYTFCEPFKGELPNFLKRTTSDYKN